MITEQDTRQIAFYNRESMPGASRSDRCNIAKKTTLHHQSRSLCRLYKGPNCKSAVRRGVLQAIGRALRLYLRPSAVAQACPETVRNSQQRQRGKRDVTGPFRQWRI
jgi:hypothetical protein